MTGHLEKHHAEEWGAYCEIRKRTKAEVAAVKKEEVESYEMENSEVRFYDVRSSTYLIFVTDSRTVSVEKKICHVEKFQISVHDRCGEV